MKSRGSAGYSAPSTSDLPPQAHAASHAVGGTDPLTPAAIGAVSSAEIFDTATVANSTGNSTITLPSGCKYLTVYATITGSASTRIFILSATNTEDGSRISIVADFPATASIILQTRNATSGGTLLDTITTDSSGRNARIDFEYNGTAWVYAGGTYPI